MTIFHALVLGVVQGVTEFLPISSSGHLVIFQSLFGMKEPELLLDISLHVGTLAAVCLFFFRDLKEIAGTLFSVSTWCVPGGGLWRRLSHLPEIRLFGLIIVGSIPTALLGLGFRHIADMVFSSVRIVGITLLVTGLLLWLTRGLKAKGRTVAELTLSDALCIGLMQGVAIVPGISRSGATIAMALFKGVDRETAARYSFLLSVPAIVGAMALELSDVPTSALPPLGPVLLGTCVAAVAGYAALSLLIRLVKRGNLYAFAPYCWLLGSAAILLGGHP
jgi:undecaprenyl-diphosphatase